MRQKDEAKAQEILRATLDEVQAVGLAGLSVEAVARRAGVATGTVYTYFKSKGALLEALYLQTKQGFAALVAPQDGAPLKAAFLSTAAAYLDYVMDHAAEIVFMSQMANSPFLSAETRAAGEAGARPVYALIERGKAEQLLKDLDTAWMMAFLTEALKGLAPHGAALGPERRAAFRQAAVQLCWDAMKA